MRKRPSLAGPLRVTIAAAVFLLIAQSTFGAAVSQAAPWTSRWVDIEPPPIDARWVDIAQVAPPPISKPESIVTPRGVIMVIITIVLTLAIFDVLFGGRRSAEDPYQQY